MPLTGEIWNHFPDIQIKALGRQFRAFKVVEIVELSVLSSWKEMVKGQIEERISKLKQNFKQPTGKVLQNVDVKACLSDLHNKYVFVPADKAPNNIIIIFLKSITSRLWLKNWDWIIAPIQQETQPTLHVKCYLKTLSIPTILSWSLLVLNCLTMTKDYLTNIGPPSCINLLWKIAVLLVLVNVLQNSCPAC